MLDKDRSIEPHLVVHLAVSALQGRYADVVSRMAFPELHDLVMPDATFCFDVRAGAPVEVHGPAELVAFGSRACERFGFYLYQPLNTVVTASDDASASGRAHALEVGVDLTTGAWTEFYGRYDDDYVRSDDGWRFSRRRFQLLARRVDGVTTTWPATSP